MNTLDILLASMMAIGFLIGYKVGVVKQISFGAGIGIGLLQAIVMYQSVGLQIYERTGWAEWICNPLAFISILAAIILMVKIIAVIVCWIFKTFHLKKVERVIGAILSTYIAVLLLASIVHISDHFSPEDKVLGKTSQRESLLYQSIAGKSIWVIEEAKKELTTDEEEQYFEETCEQGL